MATRSSTRSADRFVALHCHLAEPYLRARGARPSEDLLVSTEILESKVWPRMHGLAGRLEARRLRRDERRVAAAARAVGRLRPGRHGRLPVSGLRRTLAADDVAACDSGRRGDDPPRSSCSATARGARTPRPPTRSCGLAADRRRHPGRRAVPGRPPAGRPRRSAPRGHRSRHGRGRRRRARHTVVSSPRRSRSAAASGSSSWRRQRAGSRSCAPRRRSARSRRRSA